MRALRVVSVLAFITAAACSNSAGKKAPEAGPGAPTAQENDVLSREIEPLALRPVADENALFTTQVEASAAPEISNSGGLRQVVIDIGTEQPVRCFVYPKAINLAQTLRLFVNSVVSHVNRHEVESIDAGQINGQPFLSVVTSYLIEQDGQKGGGQVKYLASRSDNTTTLCMHDEPGYVHSFLRVASSFVQNEKFVDSDEDSTKKLLVWRTVSVQRAGKTSVGVIESRLYEGEAGYAFATSRSVLLPSEDGTVVASDEAENQFSNLEGDVLEAKYVKIINDAVAYNLGLSLESKTNYKVSGLYNGETLNGNIKVDSAMRDFASQTSDMRKLFASRTSVAPLHWTTFTPAQPNQITAVDFEKKAGAEHAGVLTLGGSKSEVEVDEQGTQKRVTTDNVTVERVWQDTHS